MKEFEYTRMPMKMFPEHTIQQYNLRKHAKNGFVYVKNQWIIYGLPQDNQVKQFLEPEGYFKVKKNKLGLRRHRTRPIHFTLVGDDFGMKYVVGKEHAEHLLNRLERHYPAISIDWTGGLYCGISLKWNYDKGYVDISWVFLGSYADRVPCQFAWWQRQVLRGLRICLYIGGGWNIGSEFMSQLPWVAKTVVL